MSGSGLKLWRSAYGHFKVDLVTTMENVLGIRLKKKSKADFDLLTETIEDVDLGQDGVRANDILQGFGHVMCFDLHIHHFKCIPCRRCLITRYSAAHCLICFYVCNSTAAIPPLELSAVQT